MCVYINLSLYIYIYIWVNMYTANFRAKRLKWNATPQCCRWMVPCQLSSSELLLGQQPGGRKPCAKLWSWKREIHTKKHGKTMGTNDDFTQRHSLHPRKMWFMRSLQDHQGLWVPVEPQNDSRMDPKMNEHHQIWWWNMAF